jgi:hypothetical protein
VYVRYVAGDLFLDAANNQPARRLPFKCAVRLEDYLPGSKITIKNAAWL